jgi:hypothetical protein
MRDDPSPADRPRPQYGEYATPEEVAKLRGDAGSVDRAAGSPAPARDAAPVSPPSVAPGAPRVDPTAPAAASGAGRTPVWDRILTIVLLVLGGLNFATSTPGNLQLGRVLSESAAMLGYDGFTATAAADAAGLWIVVLSGAILLASIVLAMARLRAGRRAFWIPVVGAVLTWIVILVATFSVLLGDASFVAELVRDQG